MTHRPLVLCIFAVGLLLGSQTAAAQEVWTVLPFNSRGVDTIQTETFRDLLQLELSREGNRSFVSSATMCSDDRCARDAALAEGADVAVYGTLSQLGQNIIASATVVDATSGTVRSAQRLTVDRAEDLDLVAERFANAINSGTRAEDIAELGNITNEETEPELRRDGDHGFGLHLGGFTPVGNGYADAGTGVSLGLGYWFETLRFALSPQVGLRFSTTGEDYGYFELPIDVGAYYILGNSDVAGLLGGGVGVRYISESREATVRTGSVIRTESTIVLEDDGWGFGMFAKAGVLLLRTYTVRLAITVDYNVTFMELNGRSNPQGVGFGVDVIF
ncbi:MAG: hypothetical protein KC561_09005 [Myxococcales bacterium]|nr:hypothetical protein [Myxococcales bacterium]